MEKETKYELNGKQYSRRELLLKYFWQFLSFEEEEKVVEMFPAETKALNSIKEGRFYENISEIGEKEDLECYPVRIFYSVGSHVYVHARSESEAIEIAKRIERLGSLPLNIEDAEYLDDSFGIGCSDDWDIDEDAETPYDDIVLKRMQEIIDEENGIKGKQKEEKTSFQEKLKEAVSEKLQEEQKQEENGGLEDVRKVNEMLKKLAEARRIHSLNLNEINKALEGINKGIEKVEYLFSNLPIFKNNISIRSNDNYENIDITYSFGGQDSEYVKTLVKIKKEDSLDTDYTESLKKIREENRRHFNALFKTLTDHENEIIKEMRSLILKNEKEMKEVINKIIGTYGIGPIEE